LSAVSSSKSNLPPAQTTHIPTSTASIPSSGAPETIVFTLPPVNVYMGFRDGVGNYKLDVLDGLGNHLKSLFDQSVTANKREAWASWDGTNDLGNKMGAGNYYVVLSKDGHFLKKIALSWVAR
jgi:flagellar hook assembly protein FlgD